MLSNIDSSNLILRRFYNCRILRSHQLVEEELWTYGGTITEPDTLNLNDAVSVNREGMIISPGFIDIQVNGGFGIDFSHDVDKTQNSLEDFRRKILSTGVTSFCPTITSTSPSVYGKVLPHLSYSNCEGLATVLGAHVEGPFISEKRKGAHKAEMIRDLANGMQTLEEVYQNLNSVKVVTLAPEIPNALDVCERLSNMGKVVCLGHTAATMEECEAAFEKGASCLTHLFNAMEPFTHKEPGPFGAMMNSSNDRQIYYGIIADGNHVHPTAIKAAYKCNRNGAVLVTVACSALGLGDGEYNIGPQTVEVKGTKAVVKGTDILAASVVTLADCIRNFKEATQCTIAVALEAATLHPAKLLGLDGVKGSLDVGMDADFVILDPKNLEVLSTWVSGTCAYERLK